MIKRGKDKQVHYHQRVEFNGQENKHSVELYSSNITVVPSPGGHKHGSSKMKLKNIVDFTWEHNFYPGQLLAVHMSGKYFAYGLKVSSGEGVVRVVYKELEQRALLRGMRTAIQDLAFAYVSTAILACVDHFGNLFIHTIESTPSGLLCDLLLKVDAEDTSATSHRVIWCPYIPEDSDKPSDEDKISKFLVLTRGSKVEVWSVHAVISKFRSIEATNPALKEQGGMMEIDQHSGTIVEAIFSPDGTALATASFDGSIKFFQVLLHKKSYSNEPQCLHKWTPHSGRPISCLFFLDDHTTNHPNIQFWRFAITGCDNNTELKVWCCEVWSCLQTIKFAPTPSTGKLPVLKAGLDLSAGYLLLSDIYNKALYILSVIKNNKEDTASITTISEFLLPYPILSFGIVDAGLRKIRPIDESLENLCPCEEDTEELLVIRMYLVQPKSLQECHIAFKPASKVSANSLMDTLTHDSLNYSEDLQDMEIVNPNGISGENCEENRSLSATIEATTNHNAGLNLMTPDAFSSPAKKENNELVSCPSSPTLGTVLSVSPSLAQAVQALNATDPPLATSELEEQAPASSGSSPSREVREIFSLIKANEEPENDNKPETTNTAIEDWPNIPMVLLKDVSKHAMQEADGFTNEEEKRKKLKDESKSTIHTVGNALELINKMESILEIIQDQRQELRELRTEVTRLRQETPISTRVESALARASQQQMACQHEFLKTLDTTIKDKIETTLPRIIEDTVEPLKHQFRLDSSRMDEVLKENLTQVINSSHVKDTLAMAAVNTAKPALDAAFKEVFTNVLLPGMEKACKNMFNQVQDAFVRGTHEYLQNVDATIDKQYQQRNEQQNETLSSLVREELQTELNRVLIILQEGTIRTIRDSIKDNLNQQLIEITNACTRATTPAIPVPAVADAQTRVMSLLQRGQLNAAFQQALSASDLGLVVLVCEKTEPARVFSSIGPQGQSIRCILQQPVILSLVQQLSADLGHRTELKYRWLEEAILNLDPNDPVTQGHMGAVLMALQKQIVAFITSNPNHSSIRRLKMLTMATRALLNQSS